MGRLTKDDITRDYYLLLGVDPRASCDVIRRAYRTLMLTGVHPDRGGSGERAILLNRAKEVLLDPQLRFEYDLRRARRRARNGISPGFRSDVWRSAAGSS